jgi:hypothetical protein
MGTVRHAGGKENEERRAVRGVEGGREKMKPKFWLKFFSASRLLISAFWGAVVVEHWHCLGMVPYRGIRHNNKKWWWSPQGWWVVYVVTLQ